MYAKEKHFSLGNLYYTTIYQLENAEISFLYERFSQVSATVLKIKDSSVYGDILY